MNIPYHRGNQNVFCCTRVWPLQVFPRARLDGRWHCCQQHGDVPAFLCNPALLLFYKNNTNFNISKNININCDIIILPLFPYQQYCQWCHIRPSLHSTSYAINVFILHLPDLVIVQPIDPTGVVFCCTHVHIILW